ncbi:LysR family transcriptional regulator [Sphingosinicella sp. LY1275]|uniref:LysR family transcriptional regulator n=1 Tax=Sphingosinicella sp. LY1275 TaxID=3095379 RepID=UPI002ADEB328|nr:LysR family transcriptional regulator [Sphingosinicella sp. LY1275]MEA1013935.1 LysR family transcriptional regulator [Sphingosinicella sp. LY1275]
MRFRHIEIFHAVYANGSISAAARSLSVSQPSVSKLLRHAEDQLGFKLFQLVRGRLVATDEAHALYREAGDVFERLNSLQQTARNLRLNGGGHIRLATVPSLALKVVPNAIARFRSMHPNASFAVHTQHHDEVVRSLLERECDIALAYDPPPHSRLVTRDLCGGELVVLFRPDIFERSEQRLPLQELEGRDVIGVAAAGPIGEVFGSAVDRLGISFRETVSAQTFYVAAALAQSDAGITIVDEFTARAWASPDLAFRYADPPLRFTLQCVSLEDRPLTKLAERFIATLSEALTEGREQPID